MKWIIGTSASCAILVAVLVALSAGAVGPKAALHSSGGIGSFRDSLLWALPHGVCTADDATWQSTVSVYAGYAQGHKSYYVLAWQSGDAEQLVSSQSRGFSDLLGVTEWLRTQRVSVYNGGVTPVRVTAGIALRTLTDEEETRLQSVLATASGGASPRASDRDAAMEPAVRWGLPSASHPATTFVSRVSIQISRMACNQITNTGSHVAILVAVTDEGRRFVRLKEEVSDKPIVLRREQVQRASTSIGLLVRELLEYDVISIGTLRAVTSPPGVALRTLTDTEVSELVEEYRRQTTCRPSGSQSKYPDQ